MGGHEPHCVGIYAGSDIHANQQMFLADWPEQYERMEELGVRVPDKNGDPVVRPIRLFHNGDLAQLSECSGHAGGASSYPSIWREGVHSQHLRKSHLDGSEHSPRVPGCIFSLRSAESTEQHYHANLCDRRPGDLRRRGKHHRGIVNMPLFRVTDPLQFVPSPLHLGMWGGLFTWNAAEALCDVADGSLTLETLDMNSIAELFEEACEDDESSEENEMLAGRELDGSQEVLAADKAALVHLLNRRVSLQQRISLVQCGDTAGLESLAQEEARMLGRQPEVVCDEWEVWQQVGGWKCDCCLLTKFDHEILWSECELCETRVHTFCQVRHSALHRCKALLLSL